MYLFLFFLSIDLSISLFLLLYLIDSIHVTGLDICSPQSKAQGVKNDR